MHQFFCKILFIFSFGLILPQMVFAAQMFFDAKAAHVQIGEKFEVNLFANAEQESINAFEGEILFPNDILDLKEVRDGNTIVNFWVDPVRSCARAEGASPKDHGAATSNGVEKPDSICFSGITPGGFNGEKGLIFSAIFETKKAGVAKFEINDARVLRNDGTGSAAILTITPFEISVSSRTPAETPAVPKVKDHERPESFVPEIARDEKLFEGKWFVVFATQDKTSGIGRYEIKESRQRIFSVFKKWLLAESPYILADQELRSNIWIKAVDKADNERVAKIIPRKPLVWYENYENWIIITVGVLVAMLVAKKLWRERRT